MNDLSDRSTDDSSTRQQSSSQSGYNEKLAEKQTRTVLVLRVLVILVLFMAAAAFSYVVFFITSSGEQDDFEVQFQGAAEKVLIAFEDIVTQRLDAMSSLAIAATAYGEDQNDEWPFVTLSAFQERASAARKQSKTLYSSVVPLVTYEQRDEWENYTLHEEDWIYEAVEFQSEWDVVQLRVSLPSYPDEAHPGHILRDDYEYGISREDGYGPYHPIWLSSPLLKGLVNFNLGSLPQWLYEIETSMNKNAIVIGRMQTPPPGEAIHGGFLSRFFATAVSIEAGESKLYEGDPFSYAFFSIYNTVKGEKKPVAVLFALMRWASYFEDLLPPNMLEVHVVLDNDCGDQASYTIDGDKVSLLGMGDLHEKIYESYGKSHSFHTNVGTRGRSQHELQTQH